MSTLKITTPMARVLQALRAGPMDTSQLYERFDFHKAGHLISEGLVELVSGYYKITAKGRELCPNRRSNMPQAPVVPVVHRKRIDTPVKHPLPIRNEEKMSNSSEVNIPKFGESEQASVSFIVREETSKSKIRFCLTNQHTIIIMTDGYPTMELDEEQTEALVTFVEDVAMSIPAYTKHFVGTASL